MFGGVHFSFYKPLLKRAQKLISVSKSVRMPFGALVYFRLRKGGMGRTGLILHRLNLKWETVRELKSWKKTIAI